MILHILHHIDPHHELADILDPPTDDGMPFILIVACIVIPLIMGFVTAAIGDDRHGGGLAWFLFGMILGPILIPIALLIPVSREHGIPLSKKDHEATRKAIQARNREIVERKLREDQQNKKP